MNKILILLIFICLYYHSLSFKVTQQKNNFQQNIRSNINELDIKNQHQNYKRLLQIQPVTGFQNLTDTTITLNSTDIENLKSYFDRNITSLKRCFRASQNGFLATNFHSKCNNIANTLTIIENTNGHKIGGFTPVTWQSPKNYVWKADTSSKSFIFSLTANAKLSLVDPNYAISNKNDFGPTFGKVFTPADIFISGNSGYNSNGAIDSRCNIGVKYKNSLFSSNNRANQISFCGSVTYKVKQYQTYQVTFQVLTQPIIPNDCFYMNIKDTKINLTSFDIVNLKSYFDRPIKTVRRCYRASQNLFLATKFHQLCNGIANTLTIIQTDSGNKIGGFTPLTWQSPLSYKWKPDLTAKSFIFSLNINAKLSLANTAYGISNKNDYGPSFGKVFHPADIYISNNANVNNNGAMDNRCNIGSMYKNTMFSSNIYSNQVNFCGAVTFAVVEYEVYEVIFQV